MGDPRVLKPAAVVIKKNLGARRTGMRPGQNVFCQKLGSVATAPGGLEPMSRALSLSPVSPSHSPGSCQFRATSHPREEFAPKTGPPRAFPATAPTPIFRCRPRALITSFTIKRNEHGDFVKRSAEFANGDKLNLNPPNSYSNHVFRRIKSLERTII